MIESFDFADPEPGFVAGLFLRSGVPGAALPEAASVERGIEHAEGPLLADALLPQDVAEGRLHLGDLVEVLEIARCGFRQRADALAD